MDDATRIDVFLPALRRQEHIAFVKLYDLMAGQLLAFVTSHIGDSHAAEDIVQDIFLKLAKHIRRFRGDGKALLAWLYIAARRACIDHHRRRARRKEHPLTQPATEIRDPSPAVDTLFDNDDVRAALSQLTEAQRSAVVLRRVVGLSGEEVGEILQCDREAVYALCARAEAALRDALTLDAGGRERLKE